MSSEIVVVPYAVGLRDGWDDFVAHSRTPMFMFNRGFMDYHSDRFEDASLMFYRGEELIGVLPATRHGDEIRSHGGLTYGGMIVGEKMKQHSMLECLDAMKKHYAEVGIVSLVYKAIPHIYHRHPAEEDRYALFRNGAELFRVEPATVIDLSGPFRVAKGRKAQVSRARREGVTVTETEDFDTFIDLENAVLREHHGTTAVHTSDELRLLHARFPENVRCHAGFLGGKMVAAALVFVYETAVHTQYLAADATAREIGALDLVISEIISLYAATCRWFDFGISTEDGGRVLNDGLIAQKEGFGGRSIAYCHYRLPIRRGEECAMTL